MLSFNPKRCVPSLFPTIRQAFLWRPPRGTLRAAAPFVDEFLTQNMGTKSPRNNLLVAVVGPTSKNPEALV